MGHYYKQCGGMQYTVVGANGKERATNVSDARKLNLVPSYSTIVSLLNKEGLNLWKEQQLIKAVLEWPPNGDADWEAQIKGIANKVGNVARDRGTKVHDGLEEYYKTGNVKEDMKEIVNAVAKLVDDELGWKNWEAEKSFCYNGYGGKVDLHTTDGDGIIIDFKTKDANDVKKLKAYPNDVMQHAAYRDGLGIANAQCYTIFVNVQIPGQVVLKTWKEEEVQRGKKMFDCLKQLWYLNNNMEIL